MAQSKFRAQIKRWSINANIDIKKLTKAIAFRLYARITDMTPVDTGRAKANWNIVDGVTADLSTHDGSGSPVVRATSSNAYTISNNLPYIVPLEEGHSKQAPVGMVKVSIASEKAILAAELGS
jgi:hypothetical protein